MSVDSTLKVRGERYGDFSIHAAIAQNLMDDMRNSGGWERLSAVQKQALTVIADKIARILSGDPNYDDNWHDIQGYAKLVEERLPKQSPERTPTPAEQVGFGNCIVCGRLGGHGGLPCPSTVPVSNGITCTALGAGLAHDGHD